MAIRLILSINAASGKGDELAAAYRVRCAEIAVEPGCEQFEVFQSVLDPDRLVLLEKWSDTESLAAHAELNLTRAPLPPGLRGDPGAREDYEYNQTR
jgi:quinol monooxygenase YgiN